MKIEAPKLRATLDRVRTLVSGRTLPILSCVKLECWNGALKISATDLDQFQSETIKLPNGDLAPTCVNIHRLFAAIPSEGNLCITEKDGRLEIKCGKSLVHLSTQKAEDFPAFPDASKHVTQGVQCSDLAEGIRAVAWAVHEDRNARPIMANIHIMSEPKMLKVEASDGRQGAFFDRPLISPKFEAMLPGEFAGRIAGALESKGAQLSISERGVLITHETGSYYCKQGEGKYPNTQPIKDYKLEQIGELEIAPMVAILDTCLALADPNKTPVGMLDFYETGVGVEFQGLDSNVSMSVEGVFLKHEARVNVGVFRKTLKAIKADKCPVFNCNEGLGLAFRSGDLLVLSTNLIGEQKP